MSDALRSSLRELSLATTSAPVDAMHTATMSVALYPPSDREMAWRTDRHALVVPYSSGTAERSIGNAPMQRVRLRSASAIFLEPGILLRLRQIEPIEFLLLSVEPAHVRAIGDGAAPGRGWQTRTMIDFADDRIAALALEIRRSLLADPLRKPAYLQSLADAALARMVCRFLGELEQPRRGEALSPGMLSRIVEHIDRQLAEPLTVGDLARLAGLSRSHFSRAFQLMTGDSPRRFVLKRRLCRARDLISGGVASLAEIAARTGFSSHAHLTTAFRKELGTTPSRYRDAFGAAASPMPRRARG